MRNIEKALENAVDLVIHKIELEAEFIANETLETSKAEVKRMIISEVFKLCKESNNNNEEN